VIIRLPELLDTESVNGARAALERAPWEDGAQSALGQAREVKRNLVVPLEHAASRAAGGIVLARLGRHDGFKAAALPKTILPLKFCRYDQDMGYGDHLDLPMMGAGAAGIRTDISMTVFLSAQDDYAGGDLVFESDYGVHRVRGNAGDAVLYPASTLHRVEPVARGSRLVAITWIQSLVRDPAKRRVLYDLAQVASKLEGDRLRFDEMLRLRKSHYNLLRMWAEQ